MRLKVILSFTVVIVLVSIIILLFMRYEAVNKDYSVLVRDYSRLSDNSRSMEEYLLAKDSLEIRSEAFTLDVQQEILSMKDFNEYVLSDLVSGNKYTLVLRLPEDVCFSCYGHLFDDLKEIIETENFLCISSFTNTRELQQIVQKAGIADRTYNSRNIQIPLDNLKSPYLFLLKRNGTAYRFHAISRSHPQMLKNYLLSLTVDDPLSFTKRRGDNKIIK